MIKKGLILTGVLILLVFAGFSIWAYTPAQPMTEALNALHSGPEVSIMSHPGWIEFSPAAIKSSQGLILYPGGRVDYRAYAPLANRIASQGYLVILTQMPFNLAVTQPAKALQVIEAYPSIQNWSIGGHSLGGAMAANFVRNHPGLVRGLVLWAAYPAESDSLVNQPVQVISIYGTQDGLATVEKTQNSRRLLPETTRFVAIEGGNHAQFGDYGEQSGDQPALISWREQQELIVRSTVQFLQSIGETK